MGIRTRIIRYPNGGKTTEYTAIEGASYSEEIVSDKMPVNEHEEEMKKLSPEERAKIKEAAKRFDRYNQFLYELAKTGELDKLTDL